MRSLFKIGRSSKIQIYHDQQFPLEDIVDVFYPAFGSDYPYAHMIHMITTANHIFCSYDQKQGRCIACALLNNAGAKGGLYLLLFAVQQSNQHRGVGTQLLKEIIQWARRRNYRFIYLHVKVDNYKAIGLYEKVGFRVQKYLPDYYRGSQNENPAGLQMILPLY